MFGEGRWGGGHEETVFTHTQLSTSQAHTSAHSLNV